MVDETGGIYCLAHAGLLPYDVSEKAVQALDKQTFNKKGDILYCLQCIARRE